MDTRMQVSRGNSVSRLSDYCGFGGKCSDSDTALVFGDERLYVNRTVLELASPVFKKQLADASKNDGDRNELELSFDIDVFAEFLSCFYPGKVGDVDKNNMFRIIPLAYKYEIERVKQKCLALLTESLNTCRNEDYVYKCLDIARKYDISGVEKTCLQIITEYCKEDIQRSDELLTLRAEVKSTVSSSIIPFLRSEACKYRFLTAGPTGNVMYIDLEGFDDAKYAKTTFKLNRYAPDLTSEMDAIVIWDVKLKVSRATTTYINEVFTLFSDEKSKVCRTAVKIVFKNAIPGRAEVIHQLMRNDLPLSIHIPEKGISIDGILWDGTYTVEVHCLMNKPSMRV